MELNASSNASSGDYYEDEWSYINRSRDYYDYKLSRSWVFLRKLDFAEPFIISIISAIEILIMILTLFALCALIKSHRSPPVFVIHLILSDLIQIICILMETFTALGVLIAYVYSLVVGAYFMACVAFERYLLVSHPIWYKSHHSPKVCCVVSVIIWFVVPLIFVGMTLFLSSILPLLIGCLIPYPIIILCFVGTYRGLSHAISLTPLKRKKILASLFLVLLTYTFLILPYLILTFILVTDWIASEFIIKCEFSLKYLLFLNPLADCVLYMFLRPDVGGVMKSVLCCCRTDTHQNSTHSRDTHSRDRSAAFPCCVSLLKLASHSQTACSSV